MKIQKHLVSKKDGKAYYKHVIILSPEVIEQSGFKEGDELLAEVKKGEVKLRKK